MEHEQGHGALAQALPAPAKGACLLGGDGAGRAPRPESVSAPTTRATGAPASLAALLTPAPHCPAPARAPTFQPAPAAASSGTLLLSGSWTARP